MYIPRTAEKQINDALNQFPVTAIIGPRQCGKSTLAKKILANKKKSVYLDLELPSDARKLENAEQFFLYNRECLICIDEIQRKPDLFPLLRALCDQQEKNGQFLVLGSAGPELLRQSSETLAGRISYCRLTPFNISETGYANMHQHWWRGGFPGSYLAVDNRQSLQWLKDFTLTYLEKDVPALGFIINTQIITKLWTMLAHSTGCLYNRSQIANSLGVTGPTVKSWTDIMEKTFMLRILMPWHVNIKKRLVKTPKIYLRDTGILHSLLEIESFNALMGHPIFGQSWETYALEQIISRLPFWQAYFYRTADGAEIDLLLIRGQKKIIVECKSSVSAGLGAGFYHCLQDIAPDKAFTVCPFPQPENYPGRQNVRIVSLDVLINEIKGM